MSDTIPILFDETTEPTRSGTLGALTPDPGTVIKELDADKIKDSLSDLSGKISGLFQDIKTVGEFQLTTVQLSVKISAEGGVSLVASGKVGASGTITLTFTKE